MEPHKLDWAQQWLADTRQLYIDGRWTTGDAGQMEKCIYPANGETIGHYHLAAEADVDAAVAAARRAFEGGPWRSMSRRERAHRLLRMADVCRQHHAELATLEALDTGKTYAEAFNDDIPEVIEFFEYYAGWTNKFYGETCPVEGDFLNYTVREPIGACGQIIPWNFPLLLAVWKLTPALAMGNTVVLKPAEATVLSTVRFFELVEEAEILPPGVINLVLGDGRVGSHIARHPGIDKVSFTGSTETGRSVLHAAADSNLKALTLELGGKSPNIVFDDVADLEAACQRNSYMIFCHKGEKCSEPTRLFVHRKIYDQVLAQMIPLAEETVCGDPFDPATDQGPQCTEQHMHRVLGYIESGKSEGARLVAGGQRDVRGSNAAGFFVRPTIFADVDNKMTIAQEEIFGPVLAVTPFETEEEVVAMANDTRYGLAAGLWTRDINRAHRVASRLDAGSVFINRYGCYDVASPFGGVKQSGWGREKAIHSLEAYTRIKSVWVSL